MVSVGISKLGCTDLIFVDPGVKINGAYYRDVLLSKQLLPVMRAVSGEFFVVQQDNAPAHRYATLCDFFFAVTVPDLWPANSPDLNLVDYWIWSVFQQRVYQSWRTTLTNWNSVCSKCGDTSSRASLTMQLASGASVFVHACRRTLGAYAVENNTTISCQPYDNIIVSCLSNTTRFLIFLM